jgi:hypothetical protein
MRSRPYCSIAALTTRLVDVPNRKIVPPSMELNAKGINSLREATLACADAAVATGRNAAVTAVFEATEENAQTATSSKKWRAVEWEQ